MRTLYNADGGVRVVVVVAVFEGVGEGGAGCLDWKQQLSMLTTKTTTTTTTMTGQMLQSRYFSTF
jgi:hypothetical protein